MSFNNNNDNSEFRALRDCEAFQRQEQHEYKQFKIERDSVKEERLRKERAKETRNSVCIVLASTFLMSAVGIAMVRHDNPYENRKIHAVTRELMSDANLLTTDNGRPIDGTMSKQELLDYIDRNRLGVEDIERALKQDLRLQLLDVGFGMDKITELYPELFDETEEKSDDVKKSLR